MGQNYLAKVGEYNVLNLTETGWQALKGQGNPRLLKPVQRAGLGASCAGAPCSGRGRG